MTKLVKYNLLSGQILAPASKSSTQRALACALLAKSVTTIHNPSLSADCIAAILCTTNFGATIEKPALQKNISQKLIVTSSGVGGTPSVAAKVATQEPNPDWDKRIINCGESGLCIRLFSSIATLYPGVTELHATGSLAKRDLQMIPPPLLDLGCKCELHNGKAPVQVCGPLQGGYLQVDGSQTSQVLSGLLIALALVEKDSIISLKSLSSSGYVDMTIQTMAAFGVKVHRHDDYSEIFIPGAQKYTACNFKTEADWSGASFILVASAFSSACGNELFVQGLDLNSTQPDKAILQALMLCGVNIKNTHKGLLAETKELSSFEFDASNCPDLFPPLAVLAAACKGTSRIFGTHRLVNKESDRGRALCELLSKAGYTVAIQENSLIIQGVPILKKKKTSADLANHTTVVINPYQDHRIAMAAALLSLPSGLNMQIEDSECVAKSWPSFFSDMDALATGE